MVTPGLAVCQQFPQRCRRFPGGAAGKVFPYAHNGERPTDPAPSQTQIPGSPILRTRTVMRRFWFLLFPLFANPQHTVPGPLRVVVNIPAYRLEAYLGDSLVQTAGVAPGMPGFRTPRGQFAISSVEWNPRWTPPDRPWAAKEKPMAPGPNNPMGRVKLNFQPLYFLHGTPFEQSIGTAASHGCVRMKNADAIELAMLVMRAGMASMSDDDLHRMSTDAATRLLQLDNPVPVELRYDLVEVRDGRVTVFRDIYSLATRPLRAELVDVLSGRGLDTTRLDTARVGLLTRRVTQHGNSISIDSLIGPAAGAR